MMMRAIVAFTLLLTFFLPTSLWAEKAYRSSAEKHYKSALKGWTRDDEAYNWASLEARLVWYATYLSSTFRSAQLERYAELYDLASVDMLKRRREEAEDSRQFDAFFISVYAGSRQFPDIGKDRNLWRLVLETTDGRVVEPESWEEVPRNQVTRTLYPYIDRWSRTYKVKFPKIVTTATKRVRLKMIGIPADSILDWDLTKLPK